MQQSLSYKANQFTASQDIRRTVWNPKVHYYVHNRQPPVSIPSQINPVHASPSHFLMIHFKITHPSMPRSPKWTLSLVSCPHTYHLPRPSHSSIFNHPNDTWRGVQTINLLVIQSSPLLSTTSSLLGPHIFLNNLFTNRFNLCSSLNVKVHVSHPYKTTGKTKNYIYVYLNLQVSIVFFYGK